VNAEKLTPRNGRLVDLGRGGPVLPARLRPDRRRGHILKKGGKNKGWNLESSKKAKNEKNGPRKNVQNKEKRTIAKEEKPTRDGKGDLKSTKDKNRPSSKRKE